MVERSWKMIERRGDYLLETRYFVAGSVFLCGVDGDDVFGLFGLG